MDLLINQKTDWQRNLNLGQVAALIVGGALYAMGLEYLFAVVMILLIIVTVLYVYHLFRNYTEIQGLVDILSIIIVIILVLYTGSSMIPA